MSGLIKIDSRERSLLAALPEAVACGLGTADVVVGDRVFLERKSVPDLAASVRDGRWRDQLARLSQICEDCPRARACVIVEGHIGPDDGFTNGIRNSSLRSALVGAFVRDGVSFFFCEGVEDMAGFIRTVAERVLRDEAPSTQLVRVPKRSDHLANDERAVALAQLRVVPGVSAKVAEAVLGECRTMGEWIEKWSGRTSELADIRLQSRRLGAALAERLVRSCGVHA